MFENLFQYYAGKLDATIQSGLKFLRYNEHMDISNDVDVIHFWKNLSESLYPKLKDFSYKLSFVPSTYFCEHIFSHLNYICSKQQNIFETSNLENILLL